MHKNGKVSLVGFALGLFGSVLNYGMGVFNVKLDQNRLKPIDESLLIITMFGFFILIFMLILAKSNSSSRSKCDPSPRRSINESTQEDSDDFAGVMTRASFLGWVFSIGIVLVRHSKAWESPFGLYLCTLSFFHYSEYLVTSITNPKTLSTDSFLLNHSRAYGIAAVASWIEYGLEAYFVPGITRIPLCTMCGFAICIAGEILRKLAMFTAMENFTHVIREKKVDDHQLVSHGVFRLCRHPSYAGWFWWSIGTQILLVNPICMVGYAVASWNFFCYRITYEEATLHSFFGEEYLRYQERVPRTGVPLVTGYTYTD